MLSPAASTRSPLPSEAELRGLVEAFYRAVRADPLLAPIFDDVVDDWDEHAGRLAGFWSTVALGNRGYKGNPFGAHTPFRHRLRAAHFERWLELWSESARQLFDPPIAALLQAKADRIAESLRAGLLFRPDASSWTSVALAPAPAGPEVGAAEITLHAKR